jgi:hypothetical protein
MKRSMQCGLVLLTMLMALSIGLAFGEKDTATTKVTTTNEMNMNKATTDELNANAVDAADDNENDAVDKNEVGEDNVIIDSVTFSPSTQYVELKNNETSEQNLTGWKMDVINKTVFTFPQFTLDANARVKVHGGMGKDSKTDLYATNSLLTNADDEVSLLDASGAVVSTSEEPNEASDKPADA